MANPTGIFWICGCFGIQNEGVEGAFQLLPVGTVGKQGHGGVSFIEGTPVGPVLKGTKRKTEAMFWVLPISGHTNVLVGW